MSYKKILLIILVVFPLNVLALNKAPIDITKMDLTSLSDALKNKIITSEQLVNLYLDRINEYSSYNAIITVNEDAINKAKELDQEREKGKLRSVLHGIPIIVKDNIDVLGMPTTAGAKALKDNYPNEDAYVIKKLKEAGVIILAKANMSEFAFQASSSRSSYGTVKNAYNPDYSAYGSSGGSAVSVALNLAPAALGTDTNSSVRVPASAANIFGYRPTLGNISRSGVLPYDPERDTVGTLTKTVNDSIILTNIIMGYDSKDSKSLKELNNYKLDMASLEGITIGVPNNFLKGSENNKLPENKETYIEIYNLMTNAISKMESNGAKIVYLDEYYTYTEDGLVLNSYSGFLFCDSFNSYLKNTKGTIRSFEQLASSSNIVSDLSSYLRNCNSTKTLDEKNENKQTLTNYLEEIYQNNNLDVIIYPTTKNKLLKRGTSGIINLSAHAASTVSFPAISAPLGFDSDGLAYGIEFMSLKNEDNKLLNIVSAYEKITKNNKLPNLAPNLYTIDKNVTELLENYLSNKKIYRKAKWLKEVEEYFKKYNESETVIEDAKNLNKDFQKRIILMYLIKILILLLIFFYLKIKIQKKRHRHRRR